MLAGVRRHAEPGNEHSMLNAFRFYSRFLAASTVDIRMPEENWQCQETSAAVNTLCTVTSAVLYECNSDSVM